MTNEAGNLGMDGINIGGEIREDTNKVTEEAVRRIQEDQKKAQQIGQQIQQDKSTNNKIAKFLAFLLSDIKNDTLIKQIYHTFLVIPNNETEATIAPKSEHLKNIVQLFTPFYPSYIQELELEEIYQDFRNTNNDISLTTYIEYIKHFMKNSQNIGKIDKNEFIILLKHIAEHYQLMERLSPEQSTEFTITLQKELGF